jgi:hypothetical protein
MFLIGFYLFVATPQMNVVGGLYKYFTSGMGSVYGSFETALSVGAFNPTAAS